MIYGYVRVSTKKQSIDRQIRNIKASYPDAFLYTEKFTGTTMQREQWLKLYKNLKAGDVIVFDSVSRMARTAEDGFKTYEELFARNIDLIFLKEPQINTTTYKKAREKSIPLTNTTIDYILDGVNKYLLALAREQILLAFQVSANEVLQLHTRTIEGLITARNSGKVLGHKKGMPLIHKDTIKNKEIILKYSKDFNGNLRDCDCIKLCNCCKKTFYKYKSELLGEGYGKRQT